MPVAHFLRTAVLMFAFILVPSAGSAADKWATPGFAPGWTNFGKGYRPVSAVKSGQVVTLSGLAVRQGGGRLGHVATLPADMRPRQRMVFNFNTHDRTARVDVLPNGQIHYVAGNTSHGWVSLDGISFSQKTSTSVKFSPGWKNYGQGYTGLNAALAGGTVMAGGLVKPGTGGVVATLPANMRPAKRLIFNLNSHDRTSRVDVRPNGEIVWVYRGPKRSWVSLNGITFDRKPGPALRLTNGWRNFGQRYEVANVRRAGNRVSVGGLVKGGKWGPIAALPRGMCPKHRLIFNLNNHDATSRVDVLPDCRIVWVAGGKKHGWINLTGISFYVNRPASAPAADRGSPR